MVFRRLAKIRHFQRTSLPKRILAIYVDSYLDNTGSSGGNGYDWNRQHNIQSFYDTVAHLHTHHIPTIACPYRTSLARFGMFGLMDSDCISYLSQSIPSPCFHHSFISTRHKRRKPLRRRPARRIRRILTSPQKAA